MIILSAMFIYLVQSIGGFLFVHLIWDVRDIKALVFKFFLGTGMGAGISSSLFFLWSRLNLAMPLFLVFEAVVLVLLIVVVWRKESGQYWRNQRFDFKTIQKRTIIWAILVLIAVSFCVLDFWLRAMTMPHGFYDAWAIWNASARFIYGTGSGWYQLFAQNAWDHSDYPLLVPLNLVLGWLLTGSSSTRIPLAFSLFMMLSLIGLLFSALLVARDFEQGSLAAILLSSVPTLAILGSFQYAEIQLALFFLATGALLYLYTTTSDTRLLILAGFFAGFSGWTKNEGLMFIAISLPVCLLMSVIEKKNLFKYYLAGLFLPALTILVLKFVTPANDLFVDQAKSFQQLFEISRYQLIFNRLWGQFVSFGYWQVSFFVVLLLYVFLVWAKPFDIKGRPWIPLLLLLFQFGGYYIIYLMTPRDLASHLDTSLVRLVFQVLPLLIFWLFSMLRSPQDVFERKLVAIRSD